MTSGEWRPERLREARASLRDHGRPISQDRFARMVGVSKRTLERYESLGSPKPPKAAALAAIVEATGRPAEFFFGPTAAAEPDTLEQALAHMFALALEQRIRPLQERLDEVERQQAAEGWELRTGRRALTTRRAA